MLNNFSNLGVVLGYKWSIVFYKYVQLSRVMEIKAEAQLSFD